MCSVRGSAKIRKFRTSAPAGGCSENAAAGIIMASPSLHACIFPISGSSCSLFFLIRPIEHRKILRLATQAVHRSTVRFVALRRRSRQGEGARDSESGWHAVRSFFSFISASFQTRSLIRSVVFAYMRCIPSCVGDMVIVGIVCLFGKREKEQTRSEKEVSGKWRCPA